MIPEARGQAGDLVQGSAGDSGDPIVEGGLVTSTAPGSAAAARSPRTKFFDIDECFSV